jgi:tricarballylate dehydrogenase
MRAKHFRAGTAGTRATCAWRTRPICAYTGAYPEKKCGKLHEATGGEANLELAKMSVSGSASILDWMRAHGVKFQPALAGTLHLGRTNAWFLGGGKAMMNALYRHAERLGVMIRYDAEVVGLDVRDGFHSASVIMIGKPYHPARRWWWQPAVSIEPGLAETGLGVQLPTIS